MFQVYYRMPKSSRWVLDECEDGYESEFEDEDQAYGCAVTLLAAGVDGDHTRFPIEVQVRDETGAEVARVHRRYLKSPAYARFEAMHA